MVTKCKNSINSFQDISLMKTFKSKNYERIISYYLSLAPLQYSVKHSYYLKVNIKTIDFILLGTRFQIGEGVYYFITITIFWLQDVYTCMYEIPRKVWICTLYGTQWPLRPVSSFQRSRTSLKSYVFSHANNPHFMMVHVGVGNHLPFKVTSVFKPTLF